MESQKQRAKKGLFSYSDIELAEKLYNRIRELKHSRREEIKQIEGLNKQIEALEKVEQLILPC